MLLFCSSPSIKKIHSLKTEPCPHGSCTPGHRHLANSCLQDGIKAALGCIQVARDALFPELLAEVVDVAGQADDILEGEGGVSIVPGLTQPRREGESRVLAGGRSKGVSGCKERKDGESTWGLGIPSREGMKLNWQAISTERRSGSSRRDEGRDGEDKTCSLSWQSGEGMEAEEDTADVGMVLQQALSTGQGGQRRHLQ